MALREFHYVRTPGEQGGVDACPGPSVGVDLGTILEQGRPPWRVTLELIAGLCEILDIADEDREVHGDVDPRYLFLDEEGALSLEGFGVRRASPSPHADLDASSTDLYGLGHCALRLLCERVAWPLPADDPEVHDDQVIDAVLEADLAGLPEAMQGDVQWFVAKLLSHDPAQRPSALDAWRTFVAFAGTVPGPSLPAWAAEAVEGGGERRSESGSDAEVLTGARRREGPLAQRMAIPEAGDGGTAFWTRDEMKRAVGRESPATGALPPQGVGGGEATDFWKPEQLAAMAERADGAPRPRRAVGAGQRRTDSEIFRRRQAERARAIPVRPPAAEEPRPSLTAEPEAARSSSSLVPVTSSVVVASDRSRGNALLLALLGMGGLGVLALLLLVAIVTVTLAYVVYSRSEASRVPLEPVSIEAPPVRIGPVGEAEPSSASTDARVRLSSSSRGTVRGCASRRVSFDGFRAFEVAVDGRPVTCLVEIEGATGTFEVTGSGDTTCDVADGRVVCEPPVVPAP